MEGGSISSSFLNSEKVNSMILDQLQAKKKKKLELKTTMMSRYSNSASALPSIKERSHLLEGGYDSFVEEAKSISTDGDPNNGH